MADPIGLLTRAQRNVLDLIAEGYTNRAIARRLFVTESTVEKHVAAVFQKLELPVRQADMYDRRVRATSLYLRSEYARPELPSMELVAV